MVIGPGAGCEGLRLSRFNDFGLRDCERVAK